MWAEKKAAALVFVSRFPGGLKGLLWFADVTLHSVWRESLPGAVRRGPSFALSSFLLGVALEHPTGWIWAWRPSGIETLLCWHTWMQNNMPTTICDYNQCVTLTQINSFCFTVNMHVGKSCSLTRSSLPTKKCVIDRNSCCSMCEQCRYQAKHYKCERKLSLLSAHRPQLHTQRRPSCLPHLVPHHGHCFWILVWGKGRTRWSLQQLGEIERWKEG